MVICTQLIIIFCKKLNTLYVNFIINTRSHDFRLFITRFDCNGNKYSFFIHTALIWNLLPSNVITACNTKLFNEHLLDTHIYQFLRGRVLR